MSAIIDKTSPITGGPLELCKEQAEVTYRGERILYEKSFYRCVDSGFEFVDEELEKANLKRVYDTYRHIHLIPLAEDLKKMRVRYGLPSSAMSLILGLGENQYGLYEDGVVPSPSVGKLLALAKDPALLTGMLESARSAFSEKLYEKYYLAIVRSMQPATYEVEKAGLGDYVFIHHFAPSRRIACKHSVSSSRKTPYNEYVYEPSF